MVILYYNNRINCLHLVGGLGHDFYFSIQLGIMIPTDELIFFRGIETTNQSYNSGISSEYSGKWPIYR